MQVRDVVIKYKNSERYKCAKREMKKVIEQLLCKQSIYNYPTTKIKESLVGNAIFEEKGEQRYK